MGILITSKRGRGETGKGSIKEASERVEGMRTDYLGSRDAEMRRFRCKIPRSK